VKGRLESLGFSVTLKADASTTDADANNKALIVVSSTVASVNVGAEFRAATVPVINWGQAVQDDFMMTGDALTNHAKVAGQTDLEFVNTSHPLAAELNGVVTIVKDVDVWSWGLPTSSAVIIARVPGVP